MKTIVTFEGQKNTIQGECKPREAMEILGLNTKEWKVVKKEINDKAVTYALERVRSLTMVETHTTEEPAAAAVETDTNSQEIGNEEDIENDYEAETEVPDSITAQPVLDTDTPATPIAKGTITIPRDELQAVLGVVCDIVQKTGLIPTLAAVKMESSPEEGLTLSATDLERSFVVNIPCEGDALAFLVDAKLLASEVKALHADIQDVVLTVENDTKGRFGLKDTVVDINSRACLPVTHVEDFPEIKPVEGLTATLGTDMRKALKAVLPAVSTNESRYILTGVYIDLPAGKVVGTDGFRLHVSDIGKFDTEPMVIPARSASLMLKYGASDLVVSEKQVASTLMGGNFTTRLIEGQFPKYAEIFPDLSNYDTVAFKSMEFFNLVPGILPVSEGSAVTMTINGRIDIEATSENGAYQWHVPAESSLPEGKAVSMRINCKYLMDAIKAYADNETITIAFPETYGPIAINGKALVMPIKH